MHTGKSRCTGKSDCEMMWVCLYIYFVSHSLSFLWLNCHTSIPDSTRELVADNLFRSSVFSVLFFDYKLPKEIYAEQPEETVPIASCLVAHTLRASLSGTFLEGRMS